jgi:hypothetical protein
MFLYATLVMENLLDQLNLAAMRSELDPRVFPTGLDQAYASNIRSAGSSTCTNSA